MPDITFTNEDLASTNKLDPAWYRCLVKEVAEGPAKKDPTSTTYTIDLVVAEGKAKETPVKTWLSDKMMSKIVIFVRAFVSKPEAGKTYPLGQAKGRHVEAYIQWNAERAANEVMDFRMPKTV